VKKEICSLIKVPKLHKNHGSFIILEYSNQLFTPKKEKNPGGPSPEATNIIQESKKILDRIFKFGIKLKKAKGNNKPQNHFGIIVKLHRNNKPKTIGKKI
jgi:hypothetical protein